MTAELCDLDLLVHAASERLVCSGEKSSIVRLYACLDRGGTTCIHHHEEIAKEQDLVSK